MNEPDVLPGQMDIYDILGGRNMEDEFYKKVLEKLLDDERDKSKRYKKAIKSALDKVHNVELDNVTVIKNVERVLSEVLESESNE